MAKKKKSESSGGGAMQFLVWHGEKIIVGIMAVIALWFAIQGLGYPALSWQPNALEEDATAADTAIKASTRTAEEEGIELPDPNHKTFAAQIREPIRPDIYRNPGEVLWLPFPPTSSQKTTGIGSAHGF